MKASLVALLALTLAGCALFEERDAAPQRISVDPWTIPEPVPRAEPYSRYGNPESYKVRGRRYVILPSPRGYREDGIASWYGTKFHGKRTSSGEPYDMFAITAAHKTLPIPCYVRVTNRDSGRQLIVRVNDRGPFHDGRIIDLSYAAAVRLGVFETGSARVTVEAIDTSPVKELTTSSTPHHFIQLGAFRNMANRDLLLDQLRAQGVNGVSVRQAHDAQGDLVRIVLGPFSTRQDADERAAHLRRQGFSAMTFQD